MYQILRQLGTVWHTYHVLQSDDLENETTCLTRTHSRCGEIQGGNMAGTRLKK